MGIPGSACPLGVFIFGDVSKVALIIFIIHMKMGKVAFQSHEAGVLLNSGKRFRSAKMRGWKSYSGREDARIYYIVMQNQYTHPLPDDPNPLS